VPLLRSDQDAHRALFSDGRPRVRRAFCAPDTGKCAFQDGGALVGRIGFAQVRRDGPSPHVRPGRRSEACRRWPPHMSRNA
jgi:hypothetical protein